MRCDKRARRFMMLGFRKMSPSCLAPCVSMRRSPIRFVLSFVFVCMESAQASVLVNATLRR